MKKFLIASGVAVMAFATVAAAQGATFVSNLTVGSTGAEVSALQSKLIASGFAIPSITAGTASYGYFGSQTKTAVMAYQAANGVPNTGFVGPLTRAALNGTVTGGSCPAGLTCTPIATAPTCPVGFVCTPVGGGTPTTGGTGSEGQIDSIDSISRGVEDEVAESDTETVLAFEYDAEDSAMTINRLDVDFTHDSDFSGTAASSGSDDLDDYIETVEITHNGKVVAEMDVDEADEDDDIFSFRFTGLNIKTAAGDTDTIGVQVTAIRNVDSDDEDTTWAVRVPADGIRAVDEAGISDTYVASDTELLETFVVGSLGSIGDIELTIDEVDESVNDATVVPVDESSDTNDVALLSFSLEAEGSDIFPQSIAFSVTATGAGVAEIANTFRLMMDGEQIGDEITIASSSATSADDVTNWSGATDTTLTLTFGNLDDDDVTIEDGDTVEFTLEADINDIDGAFSNDDYLVVALTDSDVDAEDENGDEVTDISGSASSEGTSFASSGVVVTAGASDPAATIDNNGTADTASDDRGVFVINFDVTAFEDTAFIALTGASSTSATPSSAGAYAYLESTNANDTALQTGTTSVVLERISGGTISGNYVRINAGQTASLRMTVYHDAAASSVSTRAQLYAINYAETAIAGTNQVLALPTSNFQSASVIIPN